MNKSAIRQWTAQESWLIHTMERLLSNLVGIRGKPGAVGLDTLMGVLGACGNACIVCLCLWLPTKHSPPTASARPPALGPFLGQGKNPPVRAGS
jgi:hypothetical protein